MKEPARTIYAEWMIFFKIGCCLSGLEIVRKNRRRPKSYLKKIN